MPIPALPLFKHRDTVVTPADQNQFVTQFETTMDTMSNDVIPALNLAITDINEKVTTATTARDESEDARDISVAAKNEALTAVATLQAGAIDNTTIAPNKAFSNQYINDNFVKLTENQTIEGIKTFSSSPIVPTPTTDFQSVPLKSTNITVNVGAGQAYTTINQALEYLSGFYPMYKKSGVTATINLKAGFVMAEQVLVSGIDLGWIIIVGEDAETIITHTALTTGFNGSYPAFGVDKGGTSPIIGQLFRFNVEKVGGDKPGLMAFGAGSSANVLTGKGFIGAGSTGIFATDGSTINARNANCSNAGANGIVAGEGSTINAQGANCSNAGDIGILAYASSTINARNANCSNAGAHGIFATAGSTINAITAIIQNQTTGAARVRVLEGSHIEAYGVNASGGTATVFSQAVNTLTGNGIIYQ